MPDHSSTADTNITLEKRGGDSPASYGGFVRAAVVVGLFLGLMGIGLWALDANTSADVLRPSAGDYVADPIVGEPGRMNDYFSIFGIPMDLQVYFYAGEAFAQGLDLYANPFPTENQGVRLVMPFTYPPIAGVLAQLLAQAPLHVAAILWQLASLAMLALIVAAALRLLGLRVGLGMAAMTTAIVLASFVLIPVRSGFYWGQINVLVMALVVLDFWRSRSVVLADGTTPQRTGGSDPWYSGIGVGVAAALKVYPAFFGFLFLLQRRWRAAAVSAVSFVVMQLIGAVFAPRMSWAYWTDIMWQTSRFDGIVNITSQSFMTVLKREMGTDSTLALLMWLGLSAIAVALCVYISRVALRRGDTVVPVSVFGLTACLISPFSWHHYYLWLLPLAIAACAAAVRAYLRVAPLSSPVLSGALGFVLGVLLPAVAVVCMWPYLDNVLNTGVDLYVLAFSEHRLLRFMWVLWMLLILAAVAIVEAASSRRRRFAS